MSASSSKETTFQPKLVIFDKDGTLVCFHKMWIPWATEHAQRMNEATGKDVSADLYDVFGYDQKKEKFELGSLAENTPGQIKDKIADMLISKYNFDEPSAKKIVQDTFRDVPDEGLSIEMTGNIKGLFKSLKQNDVKIAVCTSDSREGTTTFLESQDLQGHIDFLMCGDDKENVPKPDPSNALKICHKFGVKPSEAIMIGDTPADTGMGKAADLGLTIGVLTGVGSRKDLKEADIIIEDIPKLDELLMTMVKRNANGTSEE